MIVGPSGSGKTQLTEALLRESTVFEGRKTRPCHYCYAVWQPRFDGMKRQGIQFHEGIPEVADLQTWFPQGGVLVLDDLMDERGNDKRMLALFTRESHHRHITVLYLCQDLFPPGKFAKTISRNARYVIVFKNPRVRRDVVRWSSNPFQIDGETSSNSLSRARNILMGIS